MKKTTAAFAALALGVGMVAALSLPANAATPDTVTAVWLIPGGDASAPFATTQTLVSQTPGNHLSDVTVPATCGTAYQVDVYNTGDITTALLSGGVLHASHNPNEDLIAGGAGTAWRLITNDACPVDPPVAVKPANVLTTSSTIACGAATVTLRNQSAWKYAVLIEQSNTAGVWTRVAPDAKTASDTVTYPAPAGGVLVVNNLGTSKIDASATYTVNFAEDSDVVAIRYRVSSGTEADLYATLPVGQFTTKTVTTNCVKDAVTPPAATPPVQLVTPKALAFTGATTGWLLPVGGSLLGAGLLLFGLKRKFALL